MKKKEFLISKLFIAVIIGIISGFLSNSYIINIIQSIKYILGQFIFFMVPLIILGFIAPAITKMKKNAGKMLGYMLLLAYTSSIGAAFMSMFFGYSLIPHLKIGIPNENLQPIPEMLFTLDIPPVLSVLSALYLALCLGIAISKTHATHFEKLLDEFQDIMLFIVNKLVIPMLPFFIATTFAIITYEGSITSQLPIFIKIIAIVLVGHYIWLFILYSIATIASKKNPFNLIKHYLPVYLTALGTMSSAATLPIALTAAKKSSILEEEIVNFAIPLGSTVHLCGSVLTEVFFIMTVSQILYGSLPELNSMVTFIFLLGIFAVGAPGVPGGTVVASLGIISSILGFNDTGIALVLTLFALQDGFGTACNVVGDGALAIILNSIMKKKKSL